MVRDMGMVTAIKLAHIVLPLSLALALASCASSPPSSPTASSAPLRSAPHAAAALQPFTRTFDFSEAQNNPSYVLTWDTADTAKAARTHYHRPPSFSRYYESYALTSAIMSLITSVTFATVSIIWLLGYW